MVEDTEDTYEVHAAWDDNAAHDDMIVCDELPRAKELAAEMRAAGAITVFIAVRS